MHLATKKQYGQFFTKESDYILQGLEPFIAGKNVTDPFAGAGDLLDWAKRHRARLIVGYDVDGNYCDQCRIYCSDSLLTPKSYEFVITNPPYLNINKAGADIKKKYFQQTKFEDLYQLALYSLLDSQEGIVIVPINFLSAENAETIRRYFFEKFEIVRMNYFRQPVFADTTYNVIAFYYRKKTHNNAKQIAIETVIFPENQTVLIELDADSGWTIGGDAIAPIKNCKNRLGIYRLTEEHIKRGNIAIAAAYNHISTKTTLYVDYPTYNLIHSNIILLNAIDSGSEEGKVRLEDIRKYSIECLVSKPTSRHQIYLVFGNPISIEEQLDLIREFNALLKQLREKYLSLFMTNYRDKDRKRISFDFVYKMINYLYYQRSGKHLGKIVFFT